MSVKINKNTQQQRRDCDDEFDRQAVQILVDEHSTVQLLLSRYKAIKDRKKIAGVLQGS